MNVILLVCDALTASTLGCYGNDKSLSPNIDKIAGEGARFSNVFSAINTTDPSFTTIFTGKYPLSHGVVNHGSKITDVERSYTENLTFLPEVLRENGLVTIGIDWLGKWHKRGYDYYGRAKVPASEPEMDDGSVDEKPGPQQRKKKTSSQASRFFRKHIFDGDSPFDRYNWYYLLPAFARDQVRAYYRHRSKGSSRKAQKLSKKPPLSDSAGLAEMANAYIAEHAGKKDFFLFVHFWDNHVPYLAPRSFVRELMHKHEYPDTSVSDILRELEGTPAAHIVDRSTLWRAGNTVGEIMAYYDASVRYVDQNIAKICHFMEKSGILDDTLLIITADHGESLIEHDIFFDHHGLYDPQITVPLILRGPGIAEGSVYDEFVQHFDIMPTILDGLGIENAPGVFDGKSLMGLMRGECWEREFVYAEESYCQRKRMIRDRRYKYIQALNDDKCEYCRKYHARGDELYDLQEDPMELRNIVDRAITGKYRDELERFVNGLEIPRQGGTITFSDEEETNKRLRALGYL